MESRISNCQTRGNINYQSIGSGGGVKQFIEKTVDFGATDAPLTPEEYNRLQMQFISLKLLVQWFLHIICQLKV